MPKATDTQKYAVLDSVSRWNKGDFITASDVEEGEIERLSDLGVIRTATKEELDLDAAAKEELKLKQKADRQVAEDTGRTDAQTEADVKAVSETGQPLSGVQG